MGQLADAIRSKAPKNLVIVGGPACVWNYPDRWDRFVERAHQHLQRAGCTMVPIADYSVIMKQMNLSYDRFHFAHSDENKYAFGEAWASWLRYYADVKRVESDPPDTGTKKR